MINLESFFDELTTIKEAAQKCRSGSMPIHAENLANKDSYDGQGKRTTKLATPRLLMDMLGKGGKAAEKGAPLLSNQAKAMGVAGLAAGAVGKGEFDKYMLGRRVYEAQNR